MLIAKLFSVLFLPWVSLRLAHKKSLKFFLNWALDKKKILIPHMDVWTGANLPLIRLRCPANDFFTEGL